MDALNLTVRDVNGSEILFKLKPDTPLTKLVDAYRQRHNIQNDVTIIHDGYVIPISFTPRNAGMKNEDSLLIITK